MIVLLPYCLVINVKVIANCLPHQVEAAVLFQECSCLHLVSLKHLLLQLTNQLIVSSLKEDDASLKVVYQLACLPESLVIPHLISKVLLKVVSSLF